MKKFLLYLSATTGIVLVTGVLFVFGVFDFSDGKAQLIGPAHSAADDAELHNRVVDLVHTIGISTQEAVDILNGLKEEDDISTFSVKVDEIAAKRENLVMIFGQNTFIKNRVAIKDAFNTNYLPSLDAWIEAGQKAKESREKESLMNLQAEFIKAHNEYVDVLNNERKY